MQKRDLNMTVTSVEMAIAADIVIAGHEYVTPHRLAAVIGVTVRTLARWDAAGGHCRRRSRSASGPIRYRKATTVAGRPGSQGRCPECFKGGLTYDQCARLNSAPDPFDPASLRLDQSFAETVGVKKLLTTVPVRKPNRQEFVRVHPNPHQRLTPVAIIQLKEDREVFSVSGHGGGVTGRVHGGDTVHRYQSSRRTFPLASETARA